MMVVGTPLDGVGMVGGVMVCGGVGEGIPGPLTVGLLDGEGPHSAINKSRV